jgi:LysM repeat protein
VPSRLATTPTPIQTVEPTAPEPSASAPAPSPSFRATYTVKKGDTLAGVASKFKTTVAALVKANNLTTKALHVGQLLNIP